jgi:D-glycero-D-manno-heptose 1,7-bisphosphate phosphatase
MKHVGIFLDRDGTIIEEVNYLSSPDDIRIIHDSSKAIKEANALGCKVFIASNQSGVARGLFTEQQLNDVHKTLLRKLAEDNAHIDAIYYCPHHPTDGIPSFRINCDCRKPKTGMLTRAAEEHSIDLKRSFVIGDKMTDIQTGNNAGATSILVLTGYGKQELEICRVNQIPINYVATNLLDAIGYIKQNLKQKPLHS